MRTLATTFTNKNEAEAAIRRLEALGLSRERITVREVDQPGAGAPGGVFVSVKVTTEQVQPVSDILKSGSAADTVTAPPPIPSRDEPAPRLAPAAATTPPIRPVSPRETEKAEAVSPGAPHAHVAPTTSTAAEAAAKAKRARNLILFGLALIGAFMIGAWLGLLT